MMNDADGTWRPAAARDILVQRARLLAELRTFFAARDVLEVETPILSLAGTTDPQIQSLTGWFDLAGTQARYFLQTSPEFAMKRLLAAGCGSIYQIARVFRAGERGRLHNPEFTLLEWYRPGFGHHALMDEIDALLAQVLGLPSGRRSSYAEAFVRHVDCDPLTASDATLHARAVAAGLQADTVLDRDGLLDFLLSRCVAPRLGLQRPEYLVDFPASQAALARMSSTDPRVAERFELFVQGVELANGFHELTDAAEQSRRFVGDRARRRAIGLNDIPADERFLAALSHGLPPCSGVAMGVDRMLMILAGARHIDEVLAFPVERA